MRLERLKRRTRPRKMLLLIDVSGSMKARSEDNLRLAHTLVQATPNIEVFTFGTRLTRVTRALRLKRREQALAAAAHLVSDWDGGTRIGDALQAFLAVPRFGGYARGAAVVILSDGLERGDLSALRDAVAKLSRRAWRVSWLTPLAAGPGFVPQTEALIAIRRFVDDMVDGGSSAAVVAPCAFASATESRVTGIVDAHHHIWRQADLPWLVGPMQPRIFGPYEPIRRDYPIREYLDDLAGNARRQVGLCADQLGRRSVSRTRRPGCSAPPRKPAGRMRSSPMRISAPTTCGRSSTGSSATRWCGACACSCTGTRTRSIASPRAPISARTRRSAATSRGWPTMAGASICRCLPPQMPDAAGLAEACPKVTFVLQHAGMLEDLSPAGRAAWRAGMVRLAACPNVVCKLSGLGTFIHRNDPAHIAAIVAESVAMFGADRCLFGSNFPIEKLWTSYRDLVDAYLDATQSNPRHRDAILRDTAMRVYRLAP